MKKSNIDNAEFHCGIYLIMYPNEKVYVGQAQNIHKRILEHNVRARIGKRGDGKKLQKCDEKIREYYPNGVYEYYILEDCELDKLDEREKYWTNYYDATNYDKGYNFLDKGNVSGRRGVDNINASLDQDQLNMVVDLLLNNYNLSYKDIANKVNTSEIVIKRINYGHSYVNPLLKYPLRTNVHDFACKNSVYDYFNSEEELLQLKKDLKFSWWLTIEKDLVEKYDIPLKILRQINQGAKFKEIGNYSYPIRENNIRNNKNLTVEDIKKILNELRNSQESMKSIGENHKHLHRDTISRINKGTSYPIDGYDYPARATN